MTQTNTAMFCTNEACEHHLRNVVKEAKQKTSNICTAPKTVCFSCTARNFERKRG